MNHYNKLKEVFVDARKKAKGVVVFGGDLNAFPNAASEGLYIPWIEKNVYGSHNLHGPVLVDFLRSVDTYHLNSRFKEPHNTSRVADVRTKWTYTTTKMINNKTKTTYTEIDGFISDRIDIVHDVNVYQNAAGNKLYHRLVHSDWRISKPVEDLCQIIRSNDALVKNWGDIDKLIKDNASNCTYDDHRLFLKNLINRMFIEAVSTELVNPLNELQGLTVTTDIKEEVQRRLNELYNPDEKDFNNSLASSPPGEQSSFDDVSFSDEDICYELEQMKTHLPLELNKAAHKVIELGKTCFNKELLDNAMTAGDFKTILFKLPTQSEPARKIEEHEFRPYPSLLSTVYSNFLARKLNQKCGNEIHGIQFLDGRNGPEVEGIRQDKSAEIIISLTLIIEAYQKANKPLHFLIIDFEDAFEKVKLSSVMKSLNRLEDAPGDLKSAFSSILKDVNEIKVNEQKIRIPKKRGLHFGDATNKVLMASVMRMILHECDENYSWNEEEKERRDNSSDSDDSSGKTDNTDKEDNHNYSVEGDDLAEKFQKMNVGSDQKQTSKEEKIKSGRREATSRPKQYHFDNKIVLVDIDLYNLEKNYTNLAKVVVKHGLKKHKIYLFTNDPKLVGQHQSFVNKNPRARDSSLFRSSYYSKYYKHLTCLLSDAVQERIKAEQLAIYATMPEFLLKSDKEKEEFFETKLVPSLFYNCKTWKITSEEEEDLQKYIKQFFDCSGISLPFNVKDYIKEEKKKWLNRNEKAVKDFLQIGSPGDDNVEESSLKWWPDLENYLMDAYITYSLVLVPIFERCSF